MSKDKTARRSALVLHRTTSKHGSTGFEDLKNFIKEGSDFSKQIVDIIQERSELEAAYSKGVSKLATKLFKASKENSGTVSNAWHFVANDFEQTGEIHKAVAFSILEEIVKPLKVITFIEHYKNHIFSRLLLRYNTKRGKTPRRLLRKDTNSFKIGGQPKRKQKQKAMLHAGRMRSARINCLTASLVGADNYRRRST